MSVKKIITIPDPLLRQKSQKIKGFDQQLITLVQDLKDTLEAQNDPPGVGLSAVQIGVLKRVFVARLESHLKEFINPEILSYSKETSDFFEGCLSIPEFYGHVIRPETIEVKAFSQNGEKFSDTYRGLASRIIQHEIDHLDGTLFTDHIHSQKGEILRIAGTDKEGNDIFEKVEIE